MKNTPEKCVKFISNILCEKNIPKKIQIKLKTFDTQ